MSIDADGTTLLPDGEGEDHGRLFGVVGEYDARLFSVVGEDDSRPSLAIPLQWHGEGSGRRVLQGIERLGWTPVTE
jgi:hypothetical protein